MGPHSQEPDNLFFAAHLDSEAKHCCGGGEWGWASEWVVGGLTGQEAAVLQLMIFLMCTMVNINIFEPAKTYL